MTSKGIHLLDKIGFLKISKYTLLDNKGLKMVFAKTKIEIPFE